MRPSVMASVGLGGWMLALAVAPACARAQEHEYDVDTGAARQVRFVSTTQVNEFDGVTDHIDGYVVLPGTPLAAGMPTAGSKLYFEVDLASLDTGIDLRDRHMRDDYLEVEKYPYATFTGAVERVDTAQGGAFRVTAAGTMSIHGVKQSLSVPCDVRAAGTGYRASCAFDVKLSDFGISIPKLMFLKLANDIRLELAFSVTPAGGPEGGNR